MGRISLGFRDYAAHLIPGSVVLTSYLVAKVSSLSQLIEHTASLFLTYLTLGYLVGICFDALTAKITLPVLRKVFRDPMKNYFSKTKLTDKTFEGLALRKLADAFGDEFVNRQKSTVLIYYMIREIDARSTDLSEFNSRINALGNLCAALFLPVVLLGAALVYRELYFEGIIVIVSSFFLMRKNTHYRDWLARSVVREYVAIHKIQEQSSTFSE